MGLLIETCNATLTAEVVETADTVTITVTAENTTRNDCLDRTEVVLDEPLANVGSSTAPPETPYR